VGGEAVVTGRKKHVTKLNEAAISKYIANPESILSLASHIVGIRLNLNLNSAVID
jgi:hypothetical protein